MNPKNLETFPELILPLDPIVLEGSIASEDFLISGNFFASENNFISEYSLPTQEIDVDPLTSMAKDPPTVNPGDNDYNYPVTTLKNAGLKIDWDGTEYKVSVALRVELSSSERNLINNGGRLVLQSKGVGIDNSFFDQRSFDWSNDDLFYFPDQQITSSGIYRFSTVVDRRVLNEDRRFWESIGDNGRDEIAAKITLAGYSGTSLVDMAGISTNVFMGWF
jgi:hypothetical protein